MARLTLSFERWEGVKVFPSTIDVPVVEPQEEEVKGAVTQGEVMRTRAHTGAHTGTS